MTTQPDNLTPANHRWGLPYMGSKRAVAEWVVGALPAADTFVDAFAGGCAVTHCAMLSGKWRNVVAADIDPMPLSLFQRAVSGRYRHMTEWISRREFHKRKDSDPYVRYCWSFGNNGSTYLYSREVEPWKKALWQARVQGCRGLLREMGIRSDGSRADIAKNHEEYKAKYIAWYMKTRLRMSPQSLQRLQNMANMKSMERLQRLQGLESLQSMKSLERLQSMESLERLQKPQGLESLERLQRLQGLERLQSMERLERLLTIIVGDYESTLNTLDLRSATVYADPPYKGTYEYVCGSFDHERFYDWLRRTSVPVYVSEYAMPDDFACVAEKKRRCTLSATNKSLVKVERIFLHRRWLQKQI